MELRQFASILWRWWWLVVLATILAACVSYWTSARSPRVYSATATLLVGQVIQNPNPQPQDFSTSQQLAQTYIQLVRREPVLKPVVEALGLAVSWQTVALHVSARAVPGTQLIQISVTSTDPLVAKAITDEVARQLVRQSPAVVDQQEQERRDFASQQAATVQTRIREGQDELKRLDERLGWETSARAIQDLQNQIANVQQKIAAWQSTYAGLAGAAKGGGTNQLSIVEPAVASSRPVSPDVPRNVGIAAGVGLLLSIGGVLLLEYLDDTVRNGEDATRLLNVPVLGAIVRTSRLQDPAQPVATIQDRDTPLAEAYRTLYANYRAVSRRNPSPVLLVTSAVGGEGKTTTACNLAVAMARGGKRVVLCDADLRRPAVHRFFSLPGDVGLSDLLLDQSLPLEASLMHTPVAGLGVVSSGSPLPNAADLLATDALATRINQLQAAADIVIFDGPSVLPVADAAMLGPSCSGAILVVDAERTRSTLVREAKATLDRVGVGVLGVVLNRAGGRFPAYERSYSRSATEHPGWWHAISALAGGLARSSRKSGHTTTAAPPGKGAGSAMPQEQPLLSLHPVESQS